MQRIDVRTPWPAIIGVHFILHTDSMPDLSPEGHCEDRTQYATGATKVIVHREFVPDTFLFPLSFPNREKGDFSREVRLG